jgi:hypothetical protein
MGYRDASLNRFKGPNPEHLPPGPGAYEGDSIKLKRSSNKLRFSKAGREKDLLLHTGMPSDVANGCGSGAGFQYANQRSTLEKKV